MTDADIVEFQLAIDKFYKAFQKENAIETPRGKKQSLDIIRVLDTLGDRLTSHYTVNGFKTWYKLTTGQLISLNVNMSAEKEYEILPDYYKDKSDSYSACVNI